MGAGMQLAGLQSLLRAGGPILYEDKLTTSVSTCTRLGFNNIGSSIDQDGTVVVQAAASTMIPGTFLHSTVG